MTKITIDRAVVEQALKALSLALSDVDWRANSPTQPVIHKAHTALKAALAELVQLKEHCLWARNGNEPCPHVQHVEPVQEPVAFITPLMEQQMFDDWCPHKGSPDPRTIWAAAVDSVNGLLLGAPPPQRPAEPVQEPWATQERFYEALDRAVENVKQDMKVKTVTLRLPEYDMAMPIIDAYSGHVLVGPVPTPPQRKPLTIKEINALPEAKGYWPMCMNDRIVRLIRAVERARGIKEEK